MKSFLTIAGCCLVISFAAAPASADGWTVTAHFGGGAPGHPFGGHGPWTHQPWAPAFPVWGPSSWVTVTNGGRNVGFSGGYPVGGYWSRGWCQPIYFTYPWPYYAGTYLFIGNGAYLSGDVAAAGDADPAPGPGAAGHGVFMVAVAAPPNPAADRLDGIRAPLPKPATSADMPEAPASSDRVRVNLDPASKLFRSGAVDRAEGELGKLIRANPSDAEVTCNYAYVLFLREKYATAAYCLRRAMVLDPKVISSGAASIASFHDANASDAALARLDTYLATSPRDASARLVRAWALYLEVRFSDTRAELVRVLDLSPDDAQAACLRDILDPPAPAR